MNFFFLKLKVVPSPVIFLRLHKFTYLFLVDKYKTEEEKTLTRKISKLNMHSIGKKSTRMGQRFLTSIGMESTVKNL